MASDHIRGAFVIGQAGRGKGSAICSGLQFRAFRFVSGQVYPDASDNQHGNQQKYRKHDHRPVLLDRKLLDARDTSG